MIIVFRINKAGMEKMKKNNKGKLNNKKQVLIIIAVISIMVFICIVLQAYIEGYFGGKKKSVKTQTQNTINREKDGSKADSNDNKSSKTKNTKNVCTDEKNYIISPTLNGHSSVGRALVSKTKCREFESLCPCLFTPLKSSSLQQ